MITDNVAAIDAEYVKFFELTEMLASICDLLVKYAEFVFINDLNVGLSHEDVFFIVFFVFNQLEAVVGTSVFNGDEECRAVVLVNTGQVAGRC